MYLKTENLKALLYGQDLNGYQRALAQQEFRQLILTIHEMEDLVENLEEHSDATDTLQEGNDKVIYEIWSEWEMPIAYGYFSTKEKAQAAIEQEDWSLVGRTLQEVQEDGMVVIEEIPVS